MFQGTCHSRILSGMLVALFVAGIAITIMAQAPSNTINACVGRVTGIVRIVPAGTPCRRTETPIQWNITGPMGPQGPAGAQGPAGGFTVYDADGTFVGSMLTSALAAFSIDGEWYAATLGPDGYTQSNMQLWYLDTVCGDGPYYWFGAAGGPPSSSPVPLVLNQFFRGLTVIGTVGYWQLREPYVAFYGDKTPGAPPNQSYRNGPDAPCEPYVNVNYVNWYRRLVAITMPVYKLPLSMR